jgi:hypothetical protein
MSTPSATVVTPSGDAAHATAMKGGAVALSVGDAGSDKSGVHVGFGGGDEKEVNHAVSACN